MAEVIVGGVFALVTALVSGWLVEGGRRRRARKAIREEFELANDLDQSWPETARLRERAQRRLDRYVTPLPEKFRRLTKGERFTTVVTSLLTFAGTATGAAAAAREISFDSTTAANGIAIAGLIGGIAGIALVVLEAGLTTFVQTLSRASGTAWRAWRTALVAAFLTFKRPFAEAWRVLKHGRRRPGKLGKDEDRRQRS
ncbi:hypothetical protein [Pimelobacter simplex]|uniref:hypothetical protein n=1 Tax=Nocardioides simplex TaxID=2045 RepID=UPI0019314460|nr:hypothetical protein [Pimelobacter simplex]